MRQRPSPTASATAGQGVKVQHPEPVTNPKAKASRSWGRPARARRVRPKNSRQRQAQRGTQTPWWQIRPIRKGQKLRMKRAPRTKAVEREKKVRAAAQATRAVRVETMAEGIQRQ